MLTMKISLNLNVTVRVKFTQEGLAIFQANREGYVLRGMAADGYAEVELWVLMRVFGPHLSHAGPAYFKDNEIHITD